jgi:hypothetical protein
MSANAISSRVSVDSSFFGSGGLMLGASLTGLDPLRLNGRDGSEIVSSHPSSLPALLRIFVPRRACTPSRWEHTGRPTEAEERQIACTNAAGLTQTVAAEKQLLDFASQFGERRVHRRAARIEYNFPLWT